MLHGGSQFSCSESDDEGPLFGSIELFLLSLAYTLWTNFMKKIYIKSIKEKLDSSFLADGLGCQLAVITFSVTLHLFYQSLFVFVRLQTF